MDFTIKGKQNREIHESKKRFEWGGMQDKGLIILKKSSKRNQYDAKT